MGTKTITPRSNNDGQIGSSSKYWDKGFFNDLHVNNLHTSPSSTLSANAISVTANAGILFEGAIADEFETVVTAINPTADRGILLPDASGIFALTSGVGVTTLSGTTANGFVTFASSGVLDVESTIVYDGSDSGLTHTPLAWSSTKKFHVLDLNDSAASSTRNCIGLEIDYDKTVDTGGGDVITAAGLDVILNDAATSNAGTTILYGIRNQNTLANANGTTSIYGIQNALSGGDIQWGIRNVCLGGTAATTTGLYQIVEDGGIDIRLNSSADTGDYFSIATTTHGATTISTVDDDTTLAHLTLDVHGDITLDAQGKNVYMARDGSNVFDFNVDTSSMKIMDTTDSGDYFSIATTTHGATTLTTVDDDNSGSAASADLTLNIDGDIVLNSETGAGATGGIKFQQVGTEFMNFTAHHAGSFLQILGNGGTSTGDSFFIDVAEHGDTTLTTVDAAGAQGHFRIESDGDIILNPGSGNIQIQDTAAELVSAGQHIHKQVKVVLSQANCNDLHSTPIELIPSQGANTIIVPQSGIMMVDNNTSVNQTNSSADLNFHYADKEPGAYGTTTLFHIRRFMNTNHLTDIVYSLGEMSGFEISQNLTDCVDKAVEVSVDSALTNNSMTSITIYLSYHVINIS